MTYATERQFSPEPSHDPLKVVFRQPLSSADIAARKTWIESNYRVSFSYSGAEFDYVVVLEGAAGPFKGAMNSLFPKDRDGLVIQRASSQG